MSPLGQRSHPQWLLFVLGAVLVGVSVCLGWVTLLTRLCPAGAPGWDPSVRSGEKVAVVANGD